MLKRALIVVALLMLGTVAGLGNAVLGTGSNGMAGNSLTGFTCLANQCGGTQYNLVTDFAATCNGVTDDAPALMAAGNAMRANPVVQAGNGVTLIIPSGCSLALSSCPGIGAFFASVPNITIIATGANITGRSTCIKWGVGDLVFVGGQTVTAKFNTNNIGDTCVTMQTPGQEANYPVGRWVLVGGQGIQIFSFPPNYAQWEYQKVASTPSGQVCFTAPLANRYDQNTLDLGGGPSGNCAGAYCGGPGTISLLAAVWDSYFHVIGGTWNFDNQVEWNARAVINDNLTFTSGAQFCWYPTLLQTAILNNNNYTCHTEVDKEIGSITMNGGNINYFAVQSSSINSITLNNGAVTAFSGTGPATFCNNSTISGFYMGTAYGSQPQSFTGDNCNISGISCCAGSNLVAIDNVYWSYQAIGQFKTVATVSTPPGPPTWATIGGMLNMGFSGIGNADNEITIGQSFLDGSNHLVVQTSLTGASLPPPGGSGLVWFADPMRNWHCTGCFGSNDAIDYSQPGAQGMPLWSYSRRTYTCANNIVNVPNSIDIDPADSLTVAGAWQSLTINVSVADTNPADAAPMSLITAGSSFNIATGANPFLGGFNTNLKIAGTRVLTATTLTGGQAGDSLTPPGANTWVGGSGSSHGDAHSVTNGPAGQCPVVTVTWQTLR